jgi:hypothetical protein
MFRRSDKGVSFISYCLLPIGENLGAMAISRFSNGNWQSFVGAARRDIVAES